MRGGLITSDMFEEPNWYLLKKWKKKYDVVFHGDATSEGN
jgi:hypothetical protein